MSSRSDVDAYNVLLDQGFVVLRGVFSDSHLEPARSLTKEIIGYRGDGFLDPFVAGDTQYLDHRVDQGALYDVVQKYPPFQAMARNDEVLDVLEQVLGPNIMLYVNSIVYKPVGTRNEVPLHQDFLSRPDESVRYIAWMPLYDATRENGCLKVIRASHTEGFRSWHRVEGETHHDRLDEDQYEGSEIEYLEATAGDVVIFHHQLVHGSDQVSQARPRHALRVVYKGIQEGDITVPRVGPIMVRGGDPTSLQRAGLAFPVPPDGQLAKTRHPAWKRWLHRLGRRLTRI